MNKGVRGVVLCTSIIMSAASLAQDEWKPTFKTLEEGFVSPDSDLVLSLPQDMPVDVLSNLAVELDGVDISEIVDLSQFDQDYLLTIALPQIQSAGDHELRLVEYSDEGEIIERGAWRYEISASTTAGSASYSSSFDLDGGYRVDEDTSSQPDGDSFSQSKFGLLGSASGQAEASKGAWDLGADADLVLQTQRDQLTEDDNSLDKDIEIGEYLFQSERPGLSALVGHHAVSSQGLLMQDFHRRGASFNTRNAGGELAGSAFAFRTEPINGWRNGLGVGDEENRVVGGAISLNPAGEGSGAFNLTGMYLRGEGTESSGSGVAGNDLASAGDGLALIAESQLFDQRLKLRAETAATDHDPDADGVDFERERDNAHSFLAAVTPWRTDPEAPRVGIWEIGFEQQQVDELFHSLANPTLPTDRTLRRLYSTFQLGGLGLQAQVANERDNVRDDPTIPSLENDIAELAISYSPETQFDDNGDFVIPWYGHPSFSASAQSGDLRHRALAADLEDQRIDQRSPNYQVEAAFQYNTWSWNVGYGWGEEEDRTGVIENQEDELVSVAANWQIADRFDIGVYTQTNDLEPDESASTRSTIWGLAAQAALISNKLNLGIDYSLNHDRTADDSLDMESETIGVNLDWQFIEPRENRSGYTLWLRAEQQQTEDKIFPEFDDDPYQVLVGLRMNWPVSRSR